MNDTSPAVERRFRELLLQRSGEERLRMGCSMHQTTKALVLTSLRDHHPDLSPGHLRQELFLRFYGHETTPSARLKILRDLGAELERVSLHPTL